MSQCVCGSQHQQVRMWEVHAISCRCGNCCEESNWAYHIEQLKKLPKAAAGSRQCSSAPRPSEDASSAKEPGIVPPLEG